MQEPYIREGFGSNSYDNVTTVHPLGLAILVIAVLWTFIVPREKAWLPILLVACFVSTSQRLVIATLDFNFIRVMIAAATVRIIAQREYAGIRLTTLDRLVAAWVLIGAMAPTLRLGTSAAAIHNAGRAYDTLGLYAIARIWLRDGRTILTLSKTLILIAAVSAVAFLNEHLTGKNIFAIFGGVSEFTTVRDGRLRCQGPFAHPILAGVYWVGFLPLVAAQFQGRETKVWTLVGICSALAIVVFSSSSTPLLGTIATVGFGALWCARRHTHLLRWGAVTLTISLHLVMNAPVWHLIARASVVGGSTGYHRFQLIDAFINRWSEWFVIGTSSTAHWGWFLFDVANQFVREGVAGGILTLGLFLFILAFAFKGVGAGVRRARSAKEARVMWSIGTAIAAHCIMFVGISISHSNTNMLVFLWLLAATQIRWAPTSARTTAPRVRKQPPPRHRMPLHLMHRNSRRPRIRLGGIPLRVQATVTGSCARLEPQAWAQ